MTDLGVADELLMRRVQEGDRDAFLDLVRRHQHGVYGYLWKMCRDRHEAEDVAQEAFLSVWRARTTWDARLAFRPWLYRIARNALSQALRSRPSPEPRAAAAVLAAAVGLIWALRSKHEWKAPSTAGPRPLNWLGTAERAKARDDGLLLANGHELHLDRRIAWLGDDGPARTHEDWADGIVDDRAESLGLRTGLVIPQLVPDSRGDGEDEQVFPVDIEDER